MPPAEANNPLNMQWPETIPAERECPTCGRSYKSLSRHWSREGSDCEWPDLSDDGRALLDGLAVAGASADGKQSTRLRIWTTVRERARWTYEQLGLLAGSVAVEDSHENDREQSQYCVRTLSHPDLNRYRTWAGQGTPPTDLELSSTLARAWLVHAGGLVHKPEATSPALHISSRSDDERREAIAHILDNAGFDPSTGADAVILSQAEAEQLLRDLGEPVPGAMYKWCLSEPVYRAARRRHQEGDPIITCEMSLADRYKSILQLVFGELSNGKRPREIFREAVASPSPEAVAEVLGGGDLESALRVAGVVPDTTDSNPRGPRGPGDRHDSADVFAALREAADEKGEPLRTREYQAYRSEVDHNPPSRKYIRNHVGKWNDALREAGVETVSTAKNPSYQQFLDALAEIREEAGEWPMSVEYLDLQPDWAPARATVYRMEKFSGWADAIEDAKEELER